MKVKKYIKAMSYLSTSPYQKQVDGEQDLLKAKHYIDMIIERHFVYAGL